MLPGLQGIGRYSVTLLANALVEWYQKAIPWPGLSLNIAAERFCRGAACDRGGHGMLTFSGA